MTETDPKWVILGRISGLFGVRGWVKVYSATSPKENILNYSDWYLEMPEGWQKTKVLQGRVQGKGIVAHLDGCEDRDQAEALVGLEIAVERAQLPQTKGGEYYWADLEGLKVCTLDGTFLGTVDRLFETGANDVVVIQGGEQEHLIPFVETVIKSVDFSSGLITVEWDADF